ncbi:MAG TPA: orotate phosphoribosyltransferase [Candidatus Saccharimonadales bacterium]|nr:orotate phosphoribosyltransferase [Candidatus Saccharimonadales bacterium]
MHLIEKLKEKQIIQYGQFTLKSGHKSQYYFNFKSLISYPELQSSVCYELCRFITDKNAVLIGVPLGGIIVASHMSYITRQPMCMIRNCEKSYGLQNQIEGHFTSNANVILLEDVITTGQSVLNAIDVLKKHNLNVIQIICILDRGEGGVIRLNQLGYKVVTLYSVDDFLRPSVLTSLIPMTSSLGYQLLDIAKQKQTRLIASLDCDDVYNIIDIVGPHVCAIKLHGDIYNQLDIDYLIQLKIKHNFLIIEDAKMADITSICLLKLRKIKQYADIVTVHGLCGSSLPTTLGKEIGVLLIHQMTVSNHLIDTVYQNRVADMTFDGLVGFISPHKVKNYLTITTGISLDQTSDTFDQTYQTKSDADLFIVGRGIYEGDVLANVLRYKKHF